MNLTLLSLCFTMTLQPGRQMQLHWDCLIRDIPSTLWMLSIWAIRWPIQCAGLQEVGDRWGVLTIVGLHPSPTMGCPAFDGWTTFGRYNWAFSSCPGLLYYPHLLGPSPINWGLIFWRPYIHIWPPYWWGWALSIFRPTSYSTLNDFFPMPNSFHALFLVC